MAPPGGRAAGFAERLEALHARHPDAPPEVVADIVRSVLGGMGNALSGPGLSLLSELDELGQAIALARAEITALEAHDINGRHIPSATDELDAIVVHTADATNAILEACEMLDSVGAALDRSLAGTLQGTLQNVTSRIYEACSFQDIVGQRIGKVVATLKMIDAKVAGLNAALGPHRRVAKRPPDAAVSLLNGPQLAAAATGQAEIDRLLASFE